MPTNRHDIAARLRELVEGTHQTVAMVAVMLGVEELSLRLSLDDLSPHPTFDVLMAAIRYFGVDPTWLLTGEYSSASHIDAIVAAEDGRNDELQRLVTELSLQPLGWSQSNRSQNDEQSFLT